MVNERPGMDDMTRASEQDEQRRWLEELRVRGTNVSLAALAWSADSWRVAVLDLTHSMLLPRGAKSVGLAGH